MNSDTAWLSHVLSTMSLEDESAEYLLGRGAKQETYTSLGARTWRTLPEDSPPPPDDFVRQCGQRGERLDGYVVFPFYSPTLEIIGFEARSVHEKKISDFRLMPRSRWIPVFLGTNLAIPKVWSGGDVWLVEGVFDLFAMDWVVPPADAVLATVRAHLSVRHLEFLERMGNFVHIVYDEDKTGRDGSERAERELSRVNVACRRVRYVGGKDPGEIWDRYGEDGLRKAFRA